MTTTRHAHVGSRSRWPQPPSRAVVAARAYTQRSRSEYESAPAVRLGGRAGPGPGRPAMATRRTDGHAADARHELQPDRRAARPDQGAIARLARDEWKALGRSRGATAHQALKRCRRRPTTVRRGERSGRRALRSPRSKPTWPSRARTRTPKCLQDPDDRCRSATAEGLCRRSSAHARSRHRSRDGLDDVCGGDAEAVEQFVGLAAARNLADREAVHGEAGAGHRLGHRVADAARGVVILDRDQAAAGRARRGDEAVRIDRRESSTDR